MKVYFKTKKLQKICSKEKEARKELNVTRAKKLKQRMMELWAAEALADISKLPPARCHEMQGDLKGHLSVDLEHPYRLLFIPANDPVPLKEDGGLDWTQVTEIEITKIIDPH